jgi:hypothetical protein
MANKQWPKAVFGLALCVIFTACSDPETVHFNKVGYVAVSITSGQTGRAVDGTLDWDPNQQISELIHTITLTGVSGEKHTKDIPKGGGTVEFAVAPGNWNIRVEARNDAGVYKALGRTTTTVRAGATTSAPITMGPPYVVEIGSTGYMTLDEAIGAATGTANAPTKIVMLHDITVPAPESETTAYTISENTHIILTVESHESRTITFSPGNFTLFTVESGAAFILEGNGTGVLTLDGGGEDTNIFQDRKALAVSGELLLKDNAVITRFKNKIPVGGMAVSLQGGAFTMQGGAIKGNAIGVNMRGGTFTISGGAIEGNTGSGVSVQDGTFTMSGNSIIKGNGSGVSIGGLDVIFTMSGGVIEGNTRGVSIAGSGSIFTMSGDSVIKDNTGSGVEVGNDGTFNMKGGSIESNTADRGGGVQVHGIVDSPNNVPVIRNGIFNMSGGSIKGNISATYGGGVYVNIYGIFTMSGGVIEGNTAAYGGGVHVWDSGTFNMEGGNIYGSDESIKAKQNTAPESASIFVMDGATANYSGTYETGYGPNPIETTNISLPTAF